MGRVLSGFRKRPLFHRDGFPELILEFGDWHSRSPRHSGALVDFFTKGQAVVNSRMMGRNGGSPSLSLRSRVLPKHERADGDENKERQQHEDMALLGFHVFLFSQTFMRMSGGTSRPLPFAGCT
jgi:hypothetical protein